MDKLKFLLEDLECYKDTQRKAYDVTNLTAELTSDDVQQITVACFGRLN